ncbi:MFS transporter [Sphingomonas sp. G-3-2-10]|uniref:MFS transporter n=1 Tax=Sphingomonas sp. G-3-2-10 TaxID=2728838 RepID=UPI00146EFA99|nr:MFS transporter [Sphingomonas sp. G-3-2-10]NML05889.1 MFS transporter [Sphingomonas sp. G-3-2-10]
MTLLPSRRWGIVIVLHLICAFCGTISASKGVFFPSLLEEFDLSHAAGATLLSANVAVAGVVSLIGGWLMLRRVRAESFIAVLGAIIGFGFLVAGTAQSYPQLLVAYMLMSGGGISLVVTPFVLSNWFERQRGLAIGIALSGTTTSGVLFNPLLGFAVEHWGWRSGYLALGAAMLLIVPLATVLVVRTRPPEALATGGQTPAQAEGVTLREALATRAYWTVLLGYVLFWASTNAYFLHFIPAVLGMGYGLKEATLIMSVLFLLAAATKLLFGWLSDRADVRIALVASLVLASAALALLFVYLSGGNTIALQLFVPLYGLTYSAPLVLFPVFVAKLFGRRQFTIIDATIMVAGSAIGSLGSVYAGWVYDVTGTYQIAFLTLGVAMAAVGGLIWTLPAQAVARERPQPLTPSIA